MLWELRQDALSSCWEFRQNSRKSQESTVKKVAWGWDRWKPWKGHFRPMEGQKEWWRRDFPWATTGSVGLWAGMASLTREEGVRSQPCHGEQPGLPTPLGSTVGLVFSCFPGGKSACNAGDPGSIPGLGRFPGEGNGYSLQYFCLENSMDREAWWATVHGITKSWWTWMSDEH